MLQHKQILYKQTLLHKQLLLHKQIQTRYLQVALKRAQIFWTGQLDILDTSVVLISTSNVLWYYVVPFR